MSVIPPIQPFKEPKGYFEDLPDQIMARVQSKTDYSWIKWAAVAIIALSVGIYTFLPQSKTDEYLVLDNQVNLYIDANYWTAEVILSMSDNPDELLEGIIEEEFPVVDELWDTEDQNLYEL